MTKDTTERKFKSFSPWAPAGSGRSEALVIHFEEINPRGGDYTPPPFNAESLERALNNNMSPWSKKDRKLAEAALEKYPAALKAYQAALNAGDTAVVTEPELPYVQGVDSSATPLHKLP